MPIYVVTMPEVHERFIKIDASTPEEAISLVQASKGTQLALRYSRTIEPTFWVVEEIEKEADKDQPEDREDA